MGLNSPHSRMVPTQIGGPCNSRLFHFKYHHRRVEKWFNCTNSCLNWLNAKGYNLD